MWFDEQDVPVCNSSLTAVLPQLVLSTELERIRFHSACIYPPFQHTIYHNVVAIVWETLHHHHDFSALSGQHALYEGKHAER